MSIGIGTGYHGNSVVEHKDDKDRTEIDATSSELEIKQKVFEKVSQRMKELALGERSDPSNRAELNPDVIVISDDQTVVFEAQNERASMLLRRKCGWDTETINFRERVRVHPSQSQKFIEALSSAGLKIAQ
jgi:hypothetical protein